MTRKKAGGPMNFWGFSGDQELSFPSREGVSRDRIIIPEGQSPEGIIISVEGHSRFYEEMIFLGRGKTRRNSWYPPNFFLVIDIV